MKNIQKIGIVLTLFTFTSVGCSSEVVQEETSLPTQEVLSENEEVMPENQELVSENQEVMLENQELVSENQEVMPENQAVLPENQEVSSNLAAILQQAPEGETITVEGQIIGKIEDCHIFTDGNSKILVHLENENAPYDPNETIEISGIIKNHVMPDSENFKDEAYSDIPMNRMIMVNEIEIIASK
ncbi:MAG: hypothetical protein AB4368_01930 [Xenococcaceae cyanobacterium]